MTYIPKLQLVGSICKAYKVSLNNADTDESLLTDGVLSTPMSAVVVKAGDLPGIYLDKVGIQQIIDDLTLIQNCMSEPVFVDDDHETEALPEDDPDFPLEKLSLPFYIGECRFAHHRVFALRKDARYSRLAKALLTKYTNKLEIVETKYTNLLEVMEVKQTMPSIVLVHRQNGVIVLCFVITLKRRELHVYWDSDTAQTCFDQLPGLDRVLQQLSLWYIEPTSTTFTMDE